jgi:hypothetical protein
MLCSNVGIQIGHLVLTFSLFRLDRRHYALISISKACVRCHTSAECRAIQKMRHVKASALVQARVCSLHPYTLAYLPTCHA